MVLLTRRRATYEDLIPYGEASTAEIVDGDLFQSPRRCVAQSFTTLALGSALMAPLRRPRGPGWRMLFDVELQLGDDVLVADLAGWRRDRLPHAPGTVAMDDVPDWVCEICAPATGGFDRRRKLPAYARHGVTFAWVVDPLVRTLETFRLDGGGFVLQGRFTGACVVAAEPFLQTPFDLSSLWA
jgi:Uma2 family endonuclease